jgi:hypothetical protein
MVHIKMKGLPNDELHLHGVDGAKDLKKQRIGNYGCPLIKKY